MPVHREDIPRGTLDLLIMRIVMQRPMHAWGIMQRLRQLTNDVFQVTPGAIFPALQRIEECGWTCSEWQVSENNRRAKYYEITLAGRKQLTIKEAQWKAITFAVARVLQGT